MSKSHNNNIFGWIGLCILLILPNIVRTQSVKLTLFVTDSLTEESVTNYSVYIDDSIVFNMESILQRWMSSCIRLNLIK